MLAYLEGKIIQKELNNVVLLTTSGLGYRIFLTPTDSEKCVVDSNSQFWIYEQIREQAYDLFGFIDQSLLVTFEKLLTVNGVGPKMALAILAVGTISELSSAILRADAKYISQASGVGKKLAEKVILELAGKLSDTALINSGTSLPKSKHEDTEAVDALIGLGYSNKEAVELLARLDPNLTTEDKIKKIISGNY